METPADDEVLDALLTLIALKDHKDRDGKTPYYEREQPLAWDNARAVAVAAVIRRNCAVMGEGEKA